METTQAPVYVTEIISETSISIIIKEVIVNQSNVTDISLGSKNIPWPQVSIMILVLIFGVVANLSIIWIVLKNKRLRSTPNIIVVNLTIGDLLCLIVNLPFIIDFHIRRERHWVFGEFMCKFAHSSMVTSGCITVYSLMALAIERYLAIAWPWRNRDSSRCVRMSRSCFCGPTWQIVFLIWLGAFTVGAPIWVTAEVLYYQFLNYSVCIPLNIGGHFARGYDVFRLLVAYLFPLAVIIIAHTLTALALLKSVRGTVTGATEQVCSNNRSTPRVRSRVKLAIVISILSVMFFIAWLPFYVYSMWVEFHYKQDIFEGIAMHNFLAWKDIPIYLLSCLNPIMLYVLSTRFREQLYQDLFCCIAKQNFDWRPAETFSSLKSSFLTASTFRGRSTVARRSSPSKHDPMLANANELTKF
ncbi:neuropeptide Y receptor type 1-like [Lytechinus variegatus]|uniref:neuropeptide Y receptor type 1-like n=1 Tax=Lytechinus variegatus TaxID=7654 RepID=UPI001BB13BF3|nr:neuropeptide Y receptor type 1-like [Lytechinus variegatus]